jgi:hypothetical protein
VFTGQYQANRSPFHGKEKIGLYNMSSKITVVDENSENWRRAEQKILKKYEVRRCRKCDVLYVFLLKYSHNYINNISAF